MADPPAAAARAPCCVCDAPNGKHCTKCKSRHYCSKACQLVDWKQGHNKACKQLTAEFQDRLLDELMPLKVKIKKEPAFVDDVLLADDSKAATRLSAVRTETTAVKATALNGDTLDWRGTCAICLDLLPVEADQQTFYNCCCMRICTDCSNKCDAHDERCPLCRTPPPTSAAELLRRLQKHADKGNADAQLQLAAKYSTGGMGLKKSLKRAFQLYERAAAQGHAGAWFALGHCYVHGGQGVKIDLKAAVQWYRRAAEQGFPAAQFSLGELFYHGKGVAQSYDDAVKWYRLAAAQGDDDALFMLGMCHAHGQGVPLDLDGAIALCKRAAAKGHASAAWAVDQFAAHLAATRPDQFAAHLAATRPGSPT